MYVFCVEKAFSLQAALLAGLISVSAYMLVYVCIYVEVGGMPRQGMPTGLEGKERRTKGLSVALQCEIVERSLNVYTSGAFTLDGEGGLPQGICWECTDKSDNNTMCISHVSSLKDVVPVQHGKGPTG